MYQHDKLQSRFSGLENTEFFGSHIRHKLLKSAMTVNKKSITIKLLMVDFPSKLSFVISLSFSRNDSL